MRKGKGARKQDDKTPAPLDPSSSLKATKPIRRKTNRKTVAPSETVMVALDNPNGLCWVMEYAPIYASILQGIESELMARGKQMQVCSIRSREEFQGLLGGRPPDGLLFLASKNVVSLKESIGAIPCVSVLGGSCEGLFDQVTYNNTSTGRLPAQFFAEKGITCAAILGPTEPGRNTTFGTRFSSFQEAMEDAGAKVVSLLSDELYEPGNPSNQPRATEIARLVRLLKSSRPAAQGLFVMADNMLPSVYKHLAEAGIVPGEDILIVSCNSDSPYYSGLPSPLTLVDIPAKEIGRRGVEILDWRIKNPERPRGTTILYPTLTIPS